MSSKRGRKKGSKNKQKPVTNVESIHNEKINKIIQLNPQEISLDNIQGFNSDTTSNYKTDISSVCWNCCHNFDSNIFGLPLKYNKGVFYIYGYFCSFSCMMRYITDNIYNSYHKLYPILNLYHNHLYKCDIKDKIAPSKYTLKLFGGIHDIEEYREISNNNKDSIINMPLIKPINHYIENISETKKPDNNNLKLYRTKSLKKKDEKIDNYINNGNITE